MRSAALLLAVAVSVTLLASQAAADEPRTHDGWYVRAGVGPGIMFGRSRAGGGVANLNAFSLNTELAIGKTIKKGLVFGGGLFPMIAPSPRFALDGGGSGVAGGHHISGLGPFVDYYPDPKDGLHAQAALLLTGGYIDAKDGRDSASGFGLGAMMGVGYETWIHDRWSIGPLFRVTWYHLWTKSGDVKGSTDLFSPALLLAVTYH